MRRAVATLVVLLTLVGAPTRGADTPSSFLDLLGSVPDSLDVRSDLVGYVDYRAVEESRPGAARPASATEWLALRDAEDPAYDLWDAAVHGISSGSGKLLRGMFRDAAAWPDLLGFDFFEVDRELVFGSPPGNGTVLAGRFDPDAIARAVGSRGYTGADMDGHTLWCPAGGCDDGLRFDRANLDPANPFGGDLGRQEPMAVSESALLASADIATVDAMLAAAADQAPSLADDPAHRAALEALDPGARLIQATLVPPHLLLADPRAFVGEGSFEEMADRLARLADTFESIPPYQLVLMADGATSSEQVMTIALVYERGADAVVAADVIPRRIQTLDSSASGRPVRDLFAERGVTSISGSVRPSADGSHSIAVIEFRAPLASDGTDGASGEPLPSSQVYRLLIESFYRRDAAWLAPALPELG